MPETDSESATDSGEERWRRDEPSWTTPEGSMRGWTVKGRGDRFGEPYVLDVVPLAEWTRSGLRCVLLGVTRYFPRGRHSGPRADEEQWVTYQGGVYAPPVETPMGAYGGIRATQSDCGDWFWTSVSDDRHAPGVSHDTLAEAVESRTRRLAQGLRWQAERIVCTCGCRVTNDKVGHDDGCPADSEDWLPEKLTIIPRTEADR
jgi:hypothetical protein